MAAIAGIATTRDEVARGSLQATQSRLVRHYARPLVTAHHVPGQLSVVSLRNAGKRDYLAHHATPRFVGWLFGYVFDGDATVPMQAAAALERLFEAAASDRLAAVLRGLEGAFFAVLHDVTELKTYIVTDHLGLRPVYVRAASDVLQWSSEAKGAAPAYLPAAALDARGLEGFLRVGHHLDDATHLAGVRLAPAASIGVWRAGLDRPQWSRYWTWGEVAQLPGAEIPDAVAELARLWPRSVERCVAAGGERLYLWLSGGFDSRLIAAEMARQNARVHAITMGQAGSTDLAVARVVGSVLGLRVDSLTFDEATWFDNRAAMTYKTDCASHLLHLHSAAHLMEFAGQGDVFIEGLGGDFMLGDAQHVDQRFHDRRPDAAVSDHYYSGLALDHGDPYFDSPHIEPFIMHNRARRFTRAGGLAVSDHSENVLPFVDGPLVRFLMSLPDRLRASRLLYAEFSKRQYPEVFAELPHAKGTTIDGRDRTEQPVTVGGTTTVIPKNRVPLADYEQLLRTPDVLGLMERHLAPTRSLLQQLDHSHWRHFEMWRDRTWLEGPRPHKHRQSRELIARALSFELWAAQLGLKDQSVA